jgi:hypothetical protein
VKDNAVPLAPWNFNHACSLGAENNAVFDDSVRCEGHHIKSALDCAEKLPLTDPVAVRAYISPRDTSIGAVENVVGICAA